MIALVLGAAACGSDGKTATSAGDTAAGTNPSGAAQPASTQPSSTQPSSPQPSATQPVATQPGATQPIATQPPATTARAITGTSPLPAIDVVDVVSGATVGLKGILPADKPVLVWMWAPH